MECQPCGDDEEDTPQTEGEASLSGVASSSSLDEPLPDVPPLPPLKGKPEGKYVSGGSARNGWKPSVVYFKAGAKQGKPACYEEACKKAPAFGFAGGKATRCGKHRLGQMVDLVSKLCPCGKHMNFGLPGERPSACAGCKTADMVDVRSKLCPCGKHASFGLPGEVPGEAPSACADCKTTGMVDVRSKLCPCGKHASFGLPGERPSVCAGCKTADMVNVVHKLLWLASLCELDDTDDASSRYVKTTCPDVGRDGRSRPRPGKYPCRTYLLG